MKKGIKCKGANINKEPRRLLFEVLKMAATYSPALPAFYLSVKKINVGTKRRPQDVRFTELLSGGMKKNRSVVKKINVNQEGIVCLKSKTKGI